MVPTPAPPDPDKLGEDGFAVIVNALVWPTVTLEVPLNPLNVAVIVTPLVVTATPVTTPDLLTDTCVESALVQVAELVTLVDGDPSLKVADAVSCCVPPTARFSVLGVTVTPLTAAFTKKPRQPRPASAINVVNVISTNHLRLPNSIERSLEMRVRRLG